jgi:hypothetical protein
MRVMRFLLIGISDHRPELQDVEAASAEAHANLPEEDWPFRVELDRDRDQQQQRSDHDDRAEREHDVHRALDGELRKLEVQRMQVQERSVCAPSHFDLGRRRSAEYVRQDVNTCAKREALVDQPFEGRHGQAAHDDDRFSSCGGERLAKGPDSADHR